VQGHLPTLLHLGGVRVGFWVGLGLTAQGRPTLMHLDKAGLGFRVSGLGCLVFGLGFGV